MKYLSLLILILGCKGSFLPQNSTAPQAAGQEKFPCKPSITQEMQIPVRHKATITEKNPTSTVSWEETHEVRCREEESRVSPSSRMYDFAYKNIEDDNLREEWLAEHTYCVSDQFSLQQQSLSFGLKEK